MSLLANRTSSGEISPPELPYEDVLQVIKDMPAISILSKDAVEFLQKTIAQNAQTALEVILDELEKARTETATKIFEEIEECDSLIIAGIKHYIICERDLNKIKNNFMGVSRSEENL